MAGATNVTGPDSAIVDAASVIDATSKTVDAPSDGQPLEGACGTLRAGETLAVGEEVLSCNGQIRLTHQNDGNVVLYYVPNGFAMWDTKTGGQSTSRLEFRTSGELTLLGADGQSLWSNALSGLDSPVLQVTDSGNLVIWADTPGEGDAAWQSFTWFCPRPAERFAPQSLRNKTINHYTNNLLGCAEWELGFGLLLTQGSFNGSVSASAGTHDGGGVVDIRLKNCGSCAFYGDEKTDKVVRALRRAGFAAWRRGTWDSLPLHIHAVAIGDPSVSGSAAAQVEQYFAGTDGLARHGYDRELDRVGRPIPPWAASFR